MNKKSILLKPKTRNFNPCVGVCILVFEREKSSCFWCIRWSQEEEQSSGISCIQMTKQKRNHQPSKPRNQKQDEVARTSKNNKNLPKTPNKKCRTSIVFNFELIQSKKSLKEKRISLKSNYRCVGKWQWDEKTNREAICLYRKKTRK